VPTKPNRSGGVIWRPFSVACSNQATRRLS
jgi:hypothetical protein